MTPFDHSGQLVEAVDCVECNSSLEWHGRLPPDPKDIVCSDCHAERLTARAEKAEAEVDRLRTVLVVIGVHANENGDETVVQMCRASLWPERRGTPTEEKS